MTIGDLIEFGAETQEGLKRCTIFAYCLGARAQSCNWYFYSDIKLSFCRAYACFVRAGIFHNSRSLRNRSSFFNKIRKANSSKGLLGIKLFAHFFKHIKEMLHRNILMIFMKHFNKARHMSSLKIVRKVYKKIYGCSCLLALMIFIQHSNRVSNPLYTNFLKRNLTCVCFVLNVAHKYIIRKRGEENQQD